MQFTRRGDVQRAAGFLHRCAALSPTYDGGFDDPPPGFRRARERVRVGAGAASFAACTQSVLKWDLQRRAGLKVFASAARVMPGLDVVLAVPVGPAALLIGCRVTAVYDEPSRAGFAYVTLPGHPECGLEQFVVEQDEDGTVWGVVQSVSRPGSRLVALGGPAGPAVQRRMTGRYLDALRAAAG